MLALLHLYKVVHHACAIMYILAVRQLEIEEAIADAAAKEAEKAASESSQVLISRP